MEEKILENDKDTFDNDYLSEEEAKAVFDIQKSFVESYAKTKDSISVEEWLLSEVKKQLPDCSEEKAIEITSEIMQQLQILEEKKESLQKAVMEGRDKTNWLASDLVKATSHMSAQEGARYFSDLDNAISNANNAFGRTITTKSGIVNQNPNLDGFIAEQYHVQTFNLNAEANGSPYRAKVLEQNGSTYAKNSVDIEIIDEAGKVVKRYQAKYCKDAAATENAFQHGNYRGQRRLVPDGQEGSVKNSVSYIEAPDGTRSNPLTKEEAKELQSTAQNENWKDLDWNEYKAEDIARNIGKQTGYAYLQGAAIGAGMNIVLKISSGEAVEGQELIEDALTTGADFGIKAATAGALKTASEKGILNILPKGTPASTFTNIAFVAIENVKVVSKIAVGELDVEEGIDAMEETTISCVSGIAASAKGASVGVAIGTVLGPVGQAVGGFVGGTIGWMAGSKVGQAVSKGVKKIRDTAKEVFSAVGDGIKYVASGIKDAIFSFFGFW